MKAKLAILTVLLLASLARAQGTVDITVPDKVSTGTLVVAQINDLGTRSAAWMAIEPLDLEYHTDKDGSAVSFASGCQASRIVMVLTIIDWEAHHFDQRRVIVQIGKGPDPDPNPDPPPPPPGKRKVVVLAEEDRNTVYREIAVEELRKYADAKKHGWGMYDPDQKNAQKQTPPELADYLKLAADQNVKLPAMVVVVEQSSGDMATVVAFPPAGTTPESAKAAGKKVIALLKELGG